MSISRITISVPEQIAAKAQRAVESGQADSVSGYFTALAEREPDWAQARAVLDEMIDQAGGIPDEDRYWARSVLGLDEGDPT
jgi:Arc/MetJ-type ribon-helix-helix transcriptional regulator